METNVRMRMSVATAVAVMFFGSVLNRVGNP